MNNQTFHYPGAVYALDDPMVIMMILAWGLAGFFIIASAIMLRRWYKLPRYMAWPVILYGAVLSEAALEVYFHQSLVLPTGFRVTTLFLASLIVMLGIIRITWGKALKDGETNST